MKSDKERGRGIGPVFCRIIWMPDVKIQRFSAAVPTTAIKYTFLAIGYKIVVNKPVFYLQIKIK